MLTINCDYTKMPAFPRHLRCTFKHTDRGKAETYMPKTHRKDVVKSYHTVS